MLKRRQRRYQNRTSLQVYDPFKATNPLLAPLDPSEREQRRERGREDVAWWLRTYLPQYFTFPFSPSHARMFELFYVKGQLVVIVLPRDAGKGTTLFGLTMHGMTYDLLPFPTRVEYNFDIALQELYKFDDTLTNNPRYLADYDLRPGSPWRASKGLLTLNNGRQLRYIGMDQVARGTVSLNFRIDPLIANDLESLTSVRSPTQTQKIFDFMTKDIAHAGSALSEGGHTYIYVGTKISKNCATQQMIDSPMAESYEFPAIVGDLEAVKNLMDTVSQDAVNMREFNRQIREERQHLPRADRNPTSEDRRRYVVEHPELMHMLSELQSYWPERFEMWDLIFEAAKGTGAFMQEMMHDPGDAKFQKFYESWFIPYDGTLPGDNLAYGITIDLAGEPKDGTDPMVVFAGAFDYDTDDIFPIDVWCDQGTPTEMVYQAYAAFHRLRRLTADEIPVFLESQIGENSAYDLFEQIRLKELALGDAAEYQDGTPRPVEYRDPAYWVELELIVVSQTINKIVRLLEFRAKAEHRHVHYVPGDPGHELMKTQFLNFVGEPTHKHLPLERKIDIPDMVELFDRKMRAFGSEPVWES